MQFKFIYLGKSSPISHLNALQGTDKLTAALGLVLQNGYKNAINIDCWFHYKSIFVLKEVQNPHFSVTK